MRPESHRHHKCDLCPDPWHAGHTQPETSAAPKQIRFASGNNDPTIGGITDNLSEAAPLPDTLGSAPELEFLEDWREKTRNLDYLDDPQTIELMKEYAASRDKRVRELEHDMAKTERDLGLALQDFMDAQGDLRRIKNAAENSNPTYKVRIEQIIKLIESALRRESKEEK